MTKLKLLRSWRVYRTGQVVEIPSGLAAELIAKRIASEDTQQELIETAAVERAARTAEATPKRRGRRALSQPDAADSTGG